MANSSLFLQCRYVYVYPCDVIFDLTKNDLCKHCTWISSACYPCCLPFTSSLLCFGDRRGGSGYPPPRRYEVVPDPRRRCNGKKINGLKVFIEPTVAVTVSTGVSLEQLESAVRSRPINMSGPPSPPPSSVGPAIPPNTNCLNADTS